MDLGAMILALIIGLFVKLTVMVMGARLVLRLYRATRGAPSGRLWLLLPRQNLPEVRILWWSLVLFFAAELTCGIEVYVLLQSSVALGTLHAIVSGLGMGLFALGIYVYLDRTLIRYGEPRCLVNRICRGCTIRDDGGCKFLVVALLAASFVAMAAIPPLFASSRTMIVEPRRYILPCPSLNAWYDGVVVPWLTARFSFYRPLGEAYRLPSTVLAIEFHVLPVIALAVTLGGIALLRRGREIMGLRAVVFALGMLCYTYLEVIVFRVTDDALVGSLAHEMAELWFLVITAEFLHRCFGSQEGPEAAASS